MKINKFTLPEEFFNRSTLKVAKEMLGKFLVRQDVDKKICGMITEVESYIGLKDKASHASRGKTDRTKVMFGKSGIWYVYLIYGMYHCLNIVTEKGGFPAAILIRGVGDIRGPGKVCRHFQIDRSLNGRPATRNSGLWIEDHGIKINSRLIRRDKRIGVDYSGEWKDKLWRFYIR